MISGDAMAITDDVYKYMKVLNKRLMKNPDDVESLIEKGFLHFEPLEECSEGLLVLRHAVKIDPKNVDAWFWLAKTIYHGIGNPESVQEALETALKLDPNRVDCIDLLAEILSGEGEENYKKSIKLSKKAINLEPTWPAPRMRLISKLIRSEQFDEAKKFIFEGIEVFQEFELPKNASRIDDYREDLITGRTDYTKDDFYDSLKEIHEKQIENKKIHEYMEALDARLNKNPNDVVALIEKGFLYFKTLEEFDKGLLVLERAVKIDPKNVNAWFWLAKMYFHGFCFYRSAKMTLDKALKIDPNRVECIDLLAEVLSSESKRDFKKFIKLSRKAIQLEPTWPALRMRLVSSFIKNYQFEEAEKLTCEGIKVFQEFKLPKNASRMDVYRESTITGRTYYTKDDFYMVLENIKRMRKKHTK